MTANIVSAMCVVWVLAAVGCQQEQMQSEPAVASQDAALFGHFHHRGYGCDDEAGCEASADDCPHWMNVIEGTEGDDVIDGTSGSDCILGYGGNDVIRAGRGRDLVFGGAGDDDIDGGSGSDRLYGGGGNDRIRGGRGLDVLHGGGCHDFLSGGRGFDFVLGGPGFDACRGFGDCEASGAAADACASDADCGPDERCESPVGICVPADAEDCGGGPVCEITDPDDVTCDGLDGDCDGAVDEGYVVQASACGQGLCAGAGEITCEDGMLSDSCEPLGAIDDGNPCTDDFCDPDLGQVNQPVAEGTSCSDGDACNGEETCSFDAGFFPVGADQTYLLWNLDTTVDSPPVDLAALGIVPGDSILLDAEGAWLTRGRAGVVIDSLYGVFSASDVLLSGDQQFRVQDAVMAATDPFVSLRTKSGGLTTDIPEDFEIPSDGLEVVVPAGAAYLFVGTADEFYSDNAIDTAPLGVSIRYVELTCAPGEPPPDMCTP